MNVSSVTAFHLYGYGMDTKWPAYSLGLSLLPRYTREVWERAPSLSR